MPPAATGTRRQSSGAARSEFQRRRPRDHRRGRQLSLHRPSSPARIRGATTPTRGGRRTSTSRCSGTCFLTRLVTQMYFPNDPLMPLDPDLAVDSGRARAPAAGLALRSRADRARVGARLPLRHRPARARATPFEGAVMKPRAACAALPSQTVGPFFHFGLTTNARSGCLARPEARGERIRLRFRLLDGDGVPVPGRHDRTLAGGRRRQVRPSRGRAGTAARSGVPRLRPARDRRGRLLRVRDRAARPGAGRAAAACQARAHQRLHLRARPADALCTRVYFEGDPAPGRIQCSRWCPSERRAHAACAARPANRGQWNFDIRLQGEDETVFFDI